MAHINQRLDLELSPRAETVESYVLTRAAEKSWQICNRHLESEAGALFSIGGPG